MTPKPPIRPEQLLNMYVAYDMVCPVNRKFAWDKWLEELRREGEELDVLRQDEQAR